MEDTMGIYESGYMQDEEQAGHIDGLIAQEEEQARFDAIMWGWLTPKHIAVVNHYNRTGDFPDDL